MDVNCRRCHRRQTCASDIQSYSCHLRHYRCCHRWLSRTNCCSCRCSSKKYLETCHACCLRTNCRFTCPTCLSCSLHTLYPGNCYCPADTFCCPDTCCQICIVAVYAALVRSTAATTIFERPHLSEPAVEVEVDLLKSRLDSLQSVKLSSNKIGILRRPASRLWSPSEHCCCWAIRLVCCGVSGANDGTE